MINCKCGRPVRLGAERVSMDRRRGVYHYIAHTDNGTRACGDSWDCVMFKPYPEQSEKPWVKMLARWEAENATSQVRVSEEAMTCSCSHGDEVPLRRWSRLCALQVHHRLRVQISLDCDMSR